MPDKSFQVPHACTGRWKIQVIVGNAADAFILIQCKVAIYIITAIIIGSILIGKVAEFIIRSTSVASVTESSLLLLVIYW
jgi:hypothetical protein